jgi:hypothetical protein
MVYITAVHMEQGQGHEYIASVQWRNPASNETGQSTKQTMVDWINNGGVARVRDNQGNEIAVGVVNGNPPYLRTYADGTWTDNLLALPRF